jgi:serine phosphatase RsbU (regulator of sigma subunit)/anti-sigma regulatory factor (Ser/Thr protein kinase)
VLYRRPEVAEVPPGSAVSLDDYPGLPEALERLQLSFVPDVQALLEGVALEHVQRFGVRSSLRVPIVIGGETNRLLVLQWQTVIPEPGPSQILLARRFADQAGLVLEQLERRAAESAAARAAEETRRLLDLTTALTSVASLPDVAAAILTEGSRNLGAQAGMVVLHSRADDALIPVETSAAGVEAPDQATVALLEESLRSGEPLAAASLRELRERNGDTEVEATFGSWLAIPFTVARRVVGGLGLAFAEPRQLTAADLGFANSLGRQAALSIERALQYESERTIAETLQQSVLPESLPTVDGVQMAARYLPGTAAVDVGGDWFDAISLSDGRLGLAVGDVVGKGVRAAATMAQLRNALRAFALDQMKPSATVARLNRLTGEVDETAFATLVYAVVDPVRRVVRFTAAGHPAPLIVYPDRRTAFAEGGRSLPLGVSTEAAFEQAVVELPTGSTLILFTDGLVERRDSSLAAGFERLRAAAAEGPGDPERLVDHILDRLVGDDVRGDDIAVLAVRLLAAAPAPLDLRLPATVQSLDVARDALRLWLESAPLTEEQAREVVLAAWEACANAVEHPQERRGELFSLAARALDGRVLVDVTDSGQWRDGRSHPDRGLGLHLIRSVMTSVSVLRGEDGTCVRMEKAVERPEGVGAGV